MEYGYAIIMPAGFSAGVHTKIMKKLIEEGYNSGLTTLISVTDFTEFDLEKVAKLSNKRNVNLKFTKFSSTDATVILFVKGENASELLNSMALECDIKDDENKSCVYVSSSSENAKEDLCDYADIASFSDIEPHLSFNEKEGHIISFNFKALSDIKTK